MSSSISDRTLDSIPFVSNASQYQKNASENLITHGMKVVGIEMLASLLLFFRILCALMPFVISFLLIYPNT